MDKHFIWYLNHLIVVDFPPRLICFCIVAWVIPRNFINRQKLVSKALLNFPRLSKLNKWRIHRKCAELIKSRFCTLTGAGSGSTGSCFSSSSSTSSSTIRWCRVIACSTSWLSSSTTSSRASAECSPCSPIAIYWRKKKKNKGVSGDEEIMVYTDDEKLVLCTSNSNEVSSFDVLRNVFKAYIAMFQSELS